MQLDKTRLPRNDKNEMIKCSDGNFVIDTNFVNNIMESGYYPTPWNLRLLRSVYKSGKNDDPNNYRGITLSKFLTKHFNTILYNRLFLLPA